jgi:hypothetical protein
MYGESATWLGSMKGVKGAEKISTHSCIKKLKLAADSNRFSDLTEASLEYF